MKMQEHETLLVLNFARFPGCITQHNFVSINIGMGQIVDD
jgi:hypothetical protein